MNTLAVRAAMVAIAGLSLGACSTYGSDGYGYSRVAVGYGAGYYSDPYYGWYDGYYYPGSGYYVWDRQGYRHRWTSRHQRYWLARRGDRRVHSDWSGYQHQRRGDYRAGQSHRYRDRAPTTVQRQHYREGNPAVTQRRYSGERPHAEAPRHYRDQRAERPARGRGHDARSDRRGKGNSHRDRRHKRDD